jgi:hypothetical protein
LVTGRAWSAAVGLGAALLLAPLARAQAQPIVVEVVPAAVSLWEQQALDVVVRIAFEPRFVAEQAVSLFQRRLDLPFHVVVPWVHGAEGHAAEWVDAPAGSGPRLAVGDRVVAAHAVAPVRVGDRALDAVELRLRWTPLVAGRVALAPVEVRYAFATAWDEDPLRGRLPRDRVDASALSPAVALDVRALPREGRPAGFSGAVGEFEVAASANAAAAAVGDSITLELTVRGHGNLARFAAPPWPELPGCVVQGLVERRTAEARTFAFDALVVRAGLTAVPSLPFVTFSPAAGAYRTLATAPVPLRTGPAADAAALPERVRALVAADAAAVAAAAALPGWVVAAGVGALVVAAALVVGLGRRRRRRAARQTQAAALATAWAQGADAAAVAFDSFCRQCTGGAWPDPAAMAARGLPTELVERLLATAAELTAARFGGPLPAVGSVVALAGELARRA